MKKILAIAFAVLFTLALCSCTAKSGDENSTTAAATATRVAIISRTDFDSAVAGGKIPELDTPLRADYDEVESLYTDKHDADVIEATDKDDDDLPMFLINEGQRFTMIQYDAAQYFYYNGQRADGAAVICCSAKAFGFEAGNCFSDDVKFSLGNPDSSDIPAASDLFFLYSIPDNVTRLTYVKGENRVDFIFVDDNLCMTVMTATDIYDGMGNTEAAITTGTEADTSAESDTAGE